MNHISKPITCIIFSKSGCSSLQSSCMQNFIKIGDRPFMDLLSKTVIFNDQCYSILFVMLIAKYSLCNIVSNSQNSKYVFFLRGGAFYLSPFLHYMVIRYDWNYSNSNIGNYKYFI